MAGFDLILSTMRWFLRSSFSTSYFVSSIAGHTDRHSLQAQEFYRRLFKLIGGLFVSPEYAVSTSSLKQQDVIGHGSHFDVIDGAS